MLGRDIGRGPGKLRVYQRGRRWGSYEVLWSGYGKYSIGSKGSRDVSVLLLFVPDWVKTSTRENTDFLNHTNFGLSVTLHVVSVLP